jgi:hypothetical protein
MQSMKTRSTTPLLFSTAFALALLGCGPEGSITGDPDGSTEPCSDADGDTICDEDEGSRHNIDTDGDGTPDYLDTDSDADGIPDSVEKGGVPDGPPVDSDGDGTFDFRDTDSDGNGIPDEDESLEDTDSDGVADFADLDDDGDGLDDIFEIGEDATAPVDTDGDGLFDFKDTDSDGDFIHDRHETQQDTDGDGTANFRDLDSDGDSIEDSQEAGDTDPSTLPVDSDGDEIPDFLDTDSDGDGLSDEAEHLGGDGLPSTGDETDPTTADSDGDSVSDLVEVAAGTDPNDPADNPRAHGDFVFLVPYETPPSPTDDLLSFSTTFKALDLYILEDVSGSMEAEIASIKTNLAATIDALTCDAGEDPATDYCFDDVESGCGRFGSTGEVWAHLKDIDSDHQATADILPNTASGNLEQHIRALHGATTGDCASTATRLSTACFRPGSLGLIILVSDEDFHEDSWWTNDTQKQIVYDGMAELGVRVVGVTGYNDHGEIPELRSNLLAMSGGAPAVELVPSLAAIPPTHDCSGLAADPFYDGRAIVEGPDTQAATAMTCAIQAITTYMPQDAGPRLENDPSNVDWQNQPVDAVASFVDHIEVHQASAPECSEGNMVDDLDGDGFDDTYRQVLAKTPLCWRLFVKQNTTVEPSSQEPMMFTASVVIHGEGGAVLDSREVYFLVPPVIEGSAPD